MNTAGFVDQVTLAGAAGINSRTATGKRHLTDVPLLTGATGVDIVAELGAQRIIGIEVKTGAPGPSDARHPTWLRDEYGDRFLAGVVLHTYQLAERIVAALWG